MKEHESLHYRSYVLRCWAERDGTSDTRLWRFSLEDTRTGQRRGFAGLNELMRALRAELMKDDRRKGDEHVDRAD